MRNLFFVVIGVLISFGICFASNENHLRNAKVGDWIEITSTADNNGRKIEQTKRQEVISIDDKTITIKTQVTVKGNALPPKEMIVPIDRFFPQNVGVDRNLIEESDEIIRVGDQSLTCHKTKYQMSIPLKSQTASATYTDWSSSEVPLCPKIKTVVEQQVGKTTLVFTETLVDFGSAK